MGPDIIQRLTFVTAIIFIIGGVLALKKKSISSFYLFFSNFLIGSTIAIYLGNSSLQITNCMMVLLVPIVSGIVLIDRSQMYFPVALSVLIINLGCFYLEVNPLNLSVSYFLFHFIAIGSLLISTFTKQIYEVIAHFALREAKLKEIGFVAGSIAHEIKNPLGICYLNLEIAQDKQTNSPGSDISSQIEASMRGLHRISSIIESMYSLIKSDSQDKPIPLHTIEELLSGLKSYLELYRKEYDINIEIVLPDTVDRSTLFEVNLAELEQIILNLVRNACISVAKNISPLVRIEFAIKKDTLEIKVKDNGKGIRDDVREKIGESFNTGSSEGLGLGLAVCLALCNKNHCQLGISAPGEESSFNISIKRPDFPSNLGIKKDLGYINNRYGHIFKLADDLILISLRSEYSVFDKNILMDNINDQFILSDDNPYHYIVITNGVHVTKEATNYLSHKNIKDRFLSGAIIGHQKNSAHAHYVVNIMLNVLNLPYPVKIFNSLEPAWEWVSKNRNLG